MADVGKLSEQPAKKNQEIQGGARMSFASVAAMGASAEKPQNVPTKAQPAEKTTGLPSGRQSPMKAHPATLGEATTELQTSLRQLDIHGPPPVTAEALERVVPQPVHPRHRLDDEKTHLSMSSINAPSLDGKSVASAATFGLDEKESIRPDDSASVKAAEDDDSNSGPASGAPNSRVGSEAGGKAFRDQFNEITERMAPTSMRNLQWSRRLGPNSAEELRRSQIPTPSNTNGSYPSLQRPDNHPTGSMVYNYQEPDEKLLAALENPKDRLFLLQLEMQVISFIQDSIEPLLDLPPCNSFYRLLAHRLGDYYALSHFVDNSVSAVRLYRTPYCQVRTPLGEFAQKMIGPEESRPVLPSMKIMRRTGTGSEDQAPSSGANTNDQSAAPSKGTSEAGEESINPYSASSPAESTMAKDKATISREQREAKYKEARERIFGDYKEGEKAEPIGGDESGVSSSRASSVTGKRKKKNRAQDDEFDSRSSYNLYYPTSQRTGPYYDQGVQQMEYYPAFMPPSNGPMLPMPYQQPYPQYPAASGGPPIPGYHYPPQAQYPMMGMAGMYPVPAQSQSYTQYPPNPRSPYYASGPQQAQQVGIPPSMPSPTLSNLSSHSSRPPSQMSEQAWGQPGYGFPYNTTPPAYPPQPPHPSAGYGMTGVPYAYGQLPYAPSNQGSRPSHPIPGSYNRQHFNPQSKIFVPGQSSGSDSPGKPQMHQAIASSGLRPHVGGAAQAVSSPAHPHSPRKGAGAGNGQSSHSSPSTISKWSTPPTLPPKPPPPAPSALSSHTGNAETVPTFQNGTYSRPTHNPSSS